MVKNETDTKLMVLKMVVGGRKKVKKMFLTMKNTKKGRQIKQKKGHRKICPTDIYLLII